MRAVPFSSVMDPRWKNIEFVSTPFAHLRFAHPAAKNCRLTVIAQHERKLLSPNIKSCGAPPDRKPLPPDPFRHQHSAIAPPRVGGVTE
jgi:hypothetical protein